MTDLRSASTIGLDESASAIGFESASIIGIPLSASTRAVLGCFIPFVVSGSTKDRQIIPHLKQRMRIEG